ncbi:MAG: aldo/keto reductase [bacterium]|nr:aldo/keto reductase [bacterium]
MEHRQLGASGLFVPVLALGTATFGGRSEWFRKWGNTQLEEARTLVDLCLERGINFFDTADVYSDGLSEEILGQAIGHRRDQVLIATKACFRMEPGPNGLGASRHYLIRACEASLRRLGTDYIDLYQLHGFDAKTPVEESLRALEDLVRTGKVRYIGCSNFSGWHLMKSLAVSEKYGLSRYVSHQGYYSLIGREYEWELMPLALDQKIGTIVWGALGGGRLTGKVSRETPIPPNTRVSEGGTEGYVEDEKLYNIVDVLRALAEDTGKTPSQVALNWLLHRPTVTTVVIGARNADQLKANFGAVGWTLTPEQMVRLDEVSASRPIYPYWHQQNAFSERNPRPV